MGSLMSLSPPKDSQDAAIRKSGLVTPVPPHASGVFDDAIQKSPPGYAGKTLDFDKMDLREQDPGTWDPARNYKKSVRKLGSLRLR